jgi:DNA segregation ATPase FtsK/SpoIIIE-like protein
MKIELKLYDVETLLYTLDKAIFYQKERRHDVSILEHIKKIMEMQMEQYKEHLIDELEKKYREEGTLSVCSLQRQEGLGYSHAAKFIEEAKANVEHWRRIAEYRKEMEK